MQTKSTETLTVEVSTEYAEKLRKIAKLFRKSDLGQALEDFTGFVFANMLEGSCEIMDALESYDFETLEELEQVYSDAAKLNPGITSITRNISATEEGALYMTFGVGR